MGSNYYMCRIPGHSLIHCHQYRSPVSDPCHHFQMRSSLGYHPQSRILVSPDCGEHGFLSAAAVRFVAIVVEPAFGLRVAVEADALRSICVLVTFVDFPRRRLGLGQVVVVSQRAGPR